MSKNIIIGHQEVRIKDTKLGDFISLTDLAKLVHEDTSRVIGKWIELLRTIDFLHVWESTYNDNYSIDAYQQIRMKAGVPAFYMSPKQWINKTNAIGIETKAGRYGGTYAHHLIALEFCSTMDAEFRFKVFKEYTTLKQNQAENWLKGHAFFINKLESNALENSRIAEVLKDEIKKLN